MFVAPGLFPNRTHFSCLLQPSGTAHVLEISGILFTIFIVAKFDLVLI